MLRVRDKFTANFVMDVINGDRPNCAHTGRGRNRRIAYFADHYADGTLNGVFYFRWSMVHWPLVLPDPWRADGTAWINNVRCAVVRHESLSMSITRHAYLFPEMPAPAWSPSRLYRSSDHALESLLLSIQGSGDIAYLLGAVWPGAEYIHARLADNGRISALPASRFVCGTPIWQQKGRVVIRPGKYFRGLGTGWPDADIESVVNQWNARFVPVEADFRLVEGEAIRHYYHNDRYNSNANTGSLASSCMRYDERQGVLDLYVQNPDVCKMLILESEDGIIGRALVWTDADGRTIMDRIYGNDLTIQRFKDYAREQGWWSKAHQNFNSQGMFIGPEGNKAFLDTSIHIDVTKFETFPFLDTFCYLCADRIGNSPIRDFRAIAQHTDGGVGMRSGVYRPECRHCGRWLGLFSDETMCDACTAEGWSLCEYCMRWNNTGACPYCTSRSTYTHSTTTTGGTVPTGTYRFRRPVYTPPTLSPSGFDELMRIVGMAPTQLDPEDDLDNFAL